MHATDRARFATLFGQVMAYYRQDVSDFTRDLFWNAFENHDYEEVRKAFERHARDPEQGRFAPKVADLVRILVGTTTDRAAIAWGKVHDAMSSVGSYTDVIFDDPAIHATVADVGGWPKLCRTELKELGHVQHRFQTQYKAYVEKGAFDYPKVLGGDRAPDDMYAMKGLPPPKPALIGDRGRAQLVYESGGGQKTQIRFEHINKIALLALEEKKNAAS